MLAMLSKFETALLGATGLGCFFGATGRLDTVSKFDFLLSDGFLLWLCGLSFALNAVVLMPDSAAMHVGS